MYIHSKYIYISLKTMFPLKFGEDNERTIEGLRQNFEKKKVLSLSGQNNKFTSVKQ